MPSVPAHVRPSAYLTTVSQSRDLDAALGTFDSLGTPLHLETFVIVDLETSGSTPEEAGITEIGAVKVRGGEVLAEFQTLVNPGEPIPPFISLLTGINDWGGVSPVTPDFINPERPWPDLDLMAGMCHEAGYPLRERLTVYPEYALDPEWVDPGVLPYVKALADDGALPAAKVAEAIKKYGIQTEKVNPLYA
mgnify:CR=1 FL=1